MTFSLTNAGLPNSCINKNHLMNNAGIVTSVNNIKPSANGNVSISISSWTSSFGYTGWVRNNSDGFTIQWGSQNSGTVITFPRAFRNCYSVVLGQYYSGRSDHYGNISSKTNTNFTKNAWECDWIAFGIS